MNTEIQEENSRDIDLFDLIFQVGRFFSTNLFSFTIATIFSIVVGITVFFLTKKEYTSNLIATSHSFTDVQIIEIFNDLNQLIKDQDYRELAAALNLSPPQAKNIANFEVLSNYEFEKKTQKLNDDKMELKQSTTFKLIATTKDTLLFRQLEVGIKKFISKNEFAQLQLGEHRKAKELQLQSIRYRIKQHDSLMTVMERRLAKNTGAMVVTSEPSTSQALVAEMERTRIGIEQELALLQEIKILKPFTIFRKPTWPKLPILIIVSFVISNLCTLIGIVLLGPFVKKIRNR